MGYRSDFFLFAFFKTFKIATAPLFINLLRSKKTERLEQAQREHSAL